MSSFVFIDSRVADIERLIVGLAPDTQVVILDFTQDGIAQIAAALVGVTDLDSIHIISHGSSGTLYLGSTVLTEDNLDDYEDALAQIGEALSEDGDLLLYGCNVGAGATGGSFIASLAHYTGADVAASTDLTGSSAAGGDWQLEANAGLLQTGIVVSQDVQRTYAHTLDTIEGTSGNDSLTGTAAADLVSGLEGDDTLRGGQGNDTLDGGPGYDSLVGGGGNDRLIGDANSVDTMAGGGGDDTYFINHPITLESVREATGAGRDVIETSVFLVLPANVEDGRCGGGATTLYGNDLDNTITGNAIENELRGRRGSDTLNGGEGVDSMLGGAGGDLYYVDELGDVVIETSNGPAPLVDGPVALDNFTDTVVAVVNYSLSNVDYVENLTLLSTAASGTGNGLNNVITGNALGNMLSGLEGGDTIVGGGGRDTLAGGTGADQLGGGTGSDRLTGEGGADTFEFRNALNARSNVDRVMDFVTGVDEIRLDRTIFTQIGLGDLAQGAFRTGTAAQDAGDRIIYNAATGGLYYDADGSGASAAAVLFATLAAAPAVTYTDFFIVA